VIEPDDLKTITEAVRLVVVEALQDEDIRAQLARRLLPAEAPRPKLVAEWRTRLFIGEGEPIERGRATEAEARAAADPIQARGRNKCLVERRLVTTWESADRGVQAEQGRDC
jgi:hypothetical protein